MLNRILGRALVLGIIASILVASAPVVSAEEGWATWYGPGFHGKPMSNGQIFDMYDPTTVASNYHAFGTWLKVTNPINGKSVWVQVRDRGPFGDPGIKLDLSYAASLAIAHTKPSTIWVRFEVVSGPGAEPVAPTSTALSVIPTLIPRAPTSTPTQPAPPTITVPPTSTPTRPPATATPIPATPSATPTRPPATTTPTATALAATATPTATPRPTQQTSVTPSATATPVGGAALPPASGRYVVQPGETLWSITRRFGLNLDEVLALNGMSDPNALRAGQTLVLGEASATPEPTPAAPPSTATPIPAARTATPSPLPTADPPSTAEPDESVADPTVEPEIDLRTNPQIDAAADSDDRQATAKKTIFWDIARETGIPFDVLARANDLGKSGSAIGEVPPAPMETPVEPPTSLAFTNGDSDCDADRQVEMLFWVAHWSSADFSVAPELSGIADTCAAVGAASPAESP